jgi:hypothetical protein
MRVSHNQARYLDYIAAHPGCSIADVDRACRINRLAGHKWVYDGVKRLIARGIVRTEQKGGKHSLTIA